MSVPSQSPVLAAARDGREPDGEKTDRAAAVGTGTPHLLVVQASVEHSFASVQSAPSAFFGAHTGVVFVSSQT